MGGGLKEPDCRTRWLSGCQPQVLNCFNLMRTPIGDTFLVGMQFRKKRMLSSRKTF
jgi:hypothetical protein